MGWFDSKGQLGLLIEKWAIVQMRSYGANSLEMEVWAYGFWINLGQNHVKAGPELNFNAIGPVLIVKALGLFIVYLIFYELGLLAGLYVLASGHF